MPKYFTVEEANRTLPLVRRIVADIVAAHSQLVERSEEHHQRAEARGGSGDRSPPEDLEALATRVNRFIGELHELGVLFKGVDEGLVDFYAMMEGRPVFLCWKLGEDRVGWWHELEAGYAGRQRLPRAGTRDG